MANFCSNCGARLNHEDSRCFSCGMYVGNDVNSGACNGSSGQNGQTYGAGNDRGYGNNQYHSHDNNQSYNSNQGYNGGYGYNSSQGYNSNYGYNNNQGYNGQYNNGGFAPNYYVPPQTPVRRPLSVGLIIFSILNIIFGCCCGFSSVLGIAALIIAINARDAQTDQDETSKKNLSLILNVVASVLIALFVIYFIVVIALA